MMKAPKGFCGMKTARLFYTLVLVGICAGCTLNPVRSSPVFTPNPTHTAATSPLEKYFGQPSAAALETNGQTQTGGIGSYTWIKEENGHTGTQVHADAIGLPTPKEALLVTSPLHGRLYLPIPDPPAYLALAVMAVTPGEEVRPDLSSSYRFWNPIWGMAQSLPLNANAEFDLLSLDPGLYVLQVSARWQGLGGVYYGFLVQVGPQGSTPIPFTAQPTPVNSPLTTPLPQVNIRVLPPAVRIGKGIIRSLAVSPDGNWLAVNTPLGIYQYHVGGFEQAWFYPVTASTNSLVFSPDSRSLALGVNNGSIAVLDSATGSPLARMQTGEYTSLAWAPDSQRLVSGASCETVTIWNAQSGEKTHELRGGQCSEGYSGVQVTWSADGQRVYAGRSGSVVMSWDAATFQPINAFQSEGPPDAMALAVMASPTGQLLAVRDLMGATTVSILDGLTGKRLQTLDGQVNGSVLTTAWSPDGHFLAVGYGMDTGTILVWDVETGQVVHTLKGYYPCEGMAWLPDGQSLVGLAGPDGMIDIVNINTGAVQRSLAGHTPAAAYLAWTGDGLVTSDTKTLTWWDPASGQPLRSSQAGTADSRLFASSIISPDGGRIVVNSAVQDVKTGEMLASLEGASEQNRRDLAAWSPDGKRVVSSDALGMQPPVTWDAQTGKIITTLNLDAGDLRPYLQALAWSPDASMLASNSSDGTVLVWRLDTN
jgi:WD40 repeat protein